MYLHGGSARTISAEFGVTEPTVRKVLRSLGVTLRTHGESLALTKWRRVDADARAQMAAMYTAGTSIYEIARKTGWSQGTVFINLKRQGVEGRDHSTANQRRNVDHAFFRRISTEAKAYWLGFLASDGNVSPGGRNRSAAIRVDLHRRDENHLRKLLADLQSDHLITRRSGKPESSAIGFRSKEMAKDLRRYGIGPRKSKTFDPVLERIPAKLVRHFWRGMVDGDGWLYQQGNGIWNLGLCGTPMVCEKFLAFLQTSFPELRVKVRQRKDDFAEVNLGRGSVPGPARLLYGGARVYLDRKYRNFLELPLGVAD